MKSVGEVVRCVRAIDVEVLEALRGYVVAYEAAVHDFSRHLEVPITDGTGVGEILYAEQTGSPMSPSTLGRRVGLSSGATNALVNRLEQRGLVARSREHDDRRVVTLRATDRARRASEEFFGPASEELTAALASFEETELAEVRDFLRRFAAILPSRRHESDRTVGVT